MAALRLVDIGKSFSTTEVLRSLSLEMADGELLVLLGASGCGKSTLLRIVAGLESADTGEIYLGERRIDQIEPRHRNVAMVFQNYALYPHMTVAGNLAFPLKVAGLDRTTIRSKVAETAALLGLVDRLDYRPAQLSGGQRQRVALGRALIRRPDLFLLDEPLSNLDADLRVRMRREIVRLQREMGVTTIHVTHDQSEALTMADRIGLLHEGRLLQLGTPRELYDHPADLTVARFIGHPRLNTFTAVRSGNRLDPPGLGLPASLRLPNGTYVVGVRPEHIEIRPDGTYEAAVVSSEYMGDRCFMTIRRNELTLTAVGLTDPQASGQAVRFDIRTENLLIFEETTGRRLVLSA